MGEKGFGIDGFSRQMISKLAQEESGKRQYYRPVYSLHKWWARRPGAQFRSLLLAAAGHSLFRRGPDGGLSPASGYFQGHDLKDLIILDPFMGGGTTLIEANRLGAKVIGCDINPVSYWIVREALKPLDLAKLDAYFRQLEASAGGEIRELYRTACGRCGSQGCDALYTFWVRSAKCPSCGHEVLLYKRTLLNEGERRTKGVSSANPATCFCPNCRGLNEWHGGSCDCASCGHRFDPEAGTYDQGYFTCGRCGNRHALIDALAPDKKMAERPVAIEHWCGQCKRRLYKAPDEDDLCRLQSVRERLESMRGELIFPRQEILGGTSSQRWRQHNYRYYREVFSERQLLAFNILFAGLRRIPEQEYRDAFATIFSNALEYNNMMTPYNYPHRKLHHLFNYHALPLTTTPAENSFWGSGGDGAGTFANCYRRYASAKRYCERPFDKFKGAGGKIETLFSREKIAAAFVHSFADLVSTPRGALLCCGDSARLSGIPDKAADLVVTDPPYFDNIHYSELSNFFYVWLRCLTDDPNFAPESVETEREAIVNAGLQKGEERYRILLAAVFRECCRVLKDDGKLLFTFHHTKPGAWWTLASAVSEGGFRVANTFPVESEYKVNPHIRAKESLDMDLVLICEKRKGQGKLFAWSLDEARRSLAAAAGDGGRRNALYLRYMGELLKAVSASGSATYQQFRDALAEFEAL